MLFGLVLGLVLVEAGLRAGAFLTSRYHAVESPQASSGRVRILSLGDSNTFGLYVGRIAAYPHLLQTQWNGRPDHRAVEVINAGYPGDASWSVLDKLGDLLASHRPEIVTVMVGTNDYWRKPESQEGVPVEHCVERARAAVPPPAAPRGEPWRLLRAFRLLEAALPLPVDDLRGELRPAIEQLDPAWSSRLLAYLQGIIACARGAGVRVVFLTYPASAFQYGIANDAMRTAAMQGNVPVIDLAQRFAPRCPKSRCDDYLFSDQHPTRAGHAWIAEILADTLPAAVSPLLTKTSITR